MGDKRKGVAAKGITPDVATLFGLRESDRGLMRMLVMGRMQIFFGNGSG